MFTVPGTGIACLTKIKLSGFTYSQRKERELTAKERWLESPDRKFLLQRPLHGRTIMDIPMEPKRLALLVAILFFLVSLLANLLQRRYARTRLGRMLRKEESIVNFLEGIHKNLGKIEVSCTLEVQGASSPQEVGKTIHLVRNEIQSAIANIQEHLGSFRQHRRKEKVMEKQRKRLEKSSQRLSR